MAATTAVISSALRAEEGYRAITKPSKDRYLGFDRPGRIAALLVKEGDLVDANQPLIRLDDQAERIKVEQLKVESENLVRVRAQDAQLAQKRVDLKRYERAFKMGAATDLEVDSARLEVLISELSVELAQFELAQAKRAYEEAKVQLDRMSLRSPVAGRVEAIAAREGESVKEQDRILRVVQIDPLWIDVPVPMELAGRLKLGDAAKVRFSSPSGAEAPAKVIVLATVADSPSATWTVRLECPNPSGRMAGEHVSASFPGVEAAAAPLAPVEVAGSRKPDPARDPRKE